MSKTEQVVMVPLKQIVNKFDVRIALDEDRVIQFAGLYEGGVELPPAKIVAIDEDTYAYIDGRHRGAARQYLNLSDIPATIYNGSLRDNPVELFAEALESNWGGAKPPSREDIQHTILRMVELGASDKTIRERLSFIPNGAARAYIASAKSTITKRRVARALDAIASGLTVEAAAKESSLRSDFLKTVVSGKRGPWGGSRKAEQDLSVQFKAYISRQLSAANAGIANKMASLFHKVEDGEVSAKIAAGIVKSWSEHLRKTHIRVDDWKARLEGITREQDAAVKTEE